MPGRAWGLQTGSSYHDPTHRRLTQKLAAVLCEHCSSLKSLSACVRRSKPQQSQHPHVSLKRQQHQEAAACSRQGCSDSTQPRSPSLGLASQAMPKVLSHRNCESTEMAISLGTCLEEDFMQDWAIPTWASSKDTLGKVHSQPKHRATGHCALSPWEADYCIKVQSMLIQ